jgi:PIN domain nuclease of toxin-antitoxin system
MPCCGGWPSPIASRQLPAISELLNDLPQLHGLHAGGYPMAHRDPFDRLLAAQAELGGLTLVSLDPALAAFPCCLLW